MFHCCSDVGASATCRSFSLPLFMTCSCIGYVSWEVATRFFMKAAWYVTGQCAYPEDDGPANASTVFRNTIPGVCV